MACVDIQHFDLSEYKLEWTDYLREGKKFQFDRKESIGSVNSSAC